MECILIFILCIYVHVFLPCFYSFSFQAGILIVLYPCFVFDAAVGPIFLCFVLRIRYPEKVKATDFGFEDVSLSPTES